jgi:hypothetical protein
MEDKLPDKLSGFINLFYYPIKSTFRKLSSHKELSPADTRIIKEFCFYSFRRELKN